MIPLDENGGKKNFLFGLFGLFSDEKNEGPILAGGLVQKNHSTMKI